MQNAECKMQNSESAAIRGKILAESSDGRGGKIVPVESSAPGCRGTLPARACAGRILPDAALDCASVSHADD